MFLEIRKNNRMLMDISLKVYAHQARRDLRRTKSCRATKLGLVLNERVVFNTDPRISDYEMFDWLLIRNKKKTYIIL